VTQSVRLTFRTSRYGRKGQPVFTVDFGEWPESVASWLWPAMRNYEKTTSLSPPNLTEWDSLRHALPGLALVYSWEGFTLLPIESLEVEDVRDLFMDIDDTFHHVWGYDRGALRSSTARKFLLRYLLELRPDGKLQRVRGSFSPKGRGQYQPRPLIGDQVSRGKGTPPEPPIGAMPHTNPRQLKADTKKRLVSDLERIADACQKELAGYFDACEVLHRIRCEPIDRPSEESALAKMANRSRKTSEVVDTLSRKERNALIAHYLRLDNDPSASSKSPQYRGSDHFSAELSQELGVAPDRFLRCARYQYFPHQVVLVAAILLIQMASAWNVGSVMELTSNGIKGLDRPGQFLLQSIKAKTKDDTPSVLLEGKEPAVVAVQFALGRLKALKDRGWADPEETALWLSPRSNLERWRSVPVSNLSKGLDEFREKHGLIHFTFEQIRTTKLTIESLERGPIAAAEMAGHSSLGSIGGYIDHLLTTRVNSSVNLEFQRRWESEVLARIEQRATNSPLVPIGDGASCKDPASPPDDAWMRAGVCDGGGCHSDGGCPNRVLVINRDRVEEVRLTKEYYDRNWQRLHAQNPDAFAATHMPRMEFNVYLHEYLKKGPYRHLLNGKA
jgi:hypothetical protein